MKIKKESKKEETNATVEALQTHVGVQTLLEINVPHRVKITFPTGADFEDPSSQALFRGDAETFVGRVLFLAGQNRAGRCEAVGGDSFHLNILLKLHVDSPRE